MRASWLALALCVVPAAAHAGVDEIDLLVYTRTTGFRHDSIPDGIAAVQQIAAERGWVVVATEDPAMFEPTTLAEFEVVVFLSTTGDVLDDAQQTALQGFVQAGGGFVGIHSATNTEEDWPWFVGLLGTTFADHPAQQTATIHVVDATHPATVGLPDPWQRFDEWYNFDSNPSGTVDVLLRLDETTYQGGTMGRDHPIAWAHEYDGGRSFYTGLGHTIESWTEPEFLAHVAGGIEWAATVEPVGADSSTGAGDSGGDASSGPGPGTIGDDDDEGTSAEPLDSTGAADDAPPQDSGADDGTSSAGASETHSDAGCGCATAPGSTVPWLALVLFTGRRSGTRAADRRRT
jgi:type 1 glutamine amidotransferase